MIDKTIAMESQSPNLISIKSILNKLTAPISMRTITSAIRQYCLEQKQTNNKDILLAFFLNCEKKLKRNTQQDWNRTIEQQIRRIVGLEHLLHFVKNHHYSSFFSHLRLAHSRYDIESRLNEQLGEMQISEDVHLKTKYFFQWFQYLHQRREIKRHKNKEVQDLKKSRVFCQYSLKFYSFMQWKQQVKKTKIQRERAIQITNAAAKRLASGIFAHFKEKIDIIKIESQLEQAVREKIEQLSVRSVFEKLRWNKKKEEGKERSLPKQPNIWIYRFYKYLTHKISPLNNHSSVINRRNMQTSYQKLTVQLCWKGLKRLTLETNKKIVKIESLAKSNAMKDFLRIKKNSKSLKKHLHSFYNYKRNLCFKEFIVNLQSGNQTVLKNSQKINQVQIGRQQSSIQIFFATLKNKFIKSKDIKLKDRIFKQKKNMFGKRQFLSCLAECKNKKYEIYTKLQKTLYCVSFKYFKFNFQQYLAYKTSVAALKAQLSQKHIKYLLANSLKGFSRYKKIKLNESQAIMTIFKTIQQKKLSQVFQHLKQRHEVSCKLQKLIGKTQYILVKLSFITIMNRMLSNKMKIKQFYNQQDQKLKNKLFQLLKRNSSFMAQRKVEIQLISIKYSKRRLIQQLQHQLQFTKSENRLQKLRENIDKKLLFSCILQQSTACQNAQAKRIQVARMLLANRLYEFSSSANDFMDYRKEQARLTYKLQKALVQGVYRIFRKNVAANREVKSYREEIAANHQNKIVEINNMLTKACLLKLVRSNKVALKEKESQIQANRINTGLNCLRFYKNISKLKKILKSTHKKQFLSLLKSKLALKKRSSKCVKVLKKSKLKDAIVTMQDNIAFSIEQRQSKTLQVQEWVNNRRVFSYQTDFFTRLRNLTDLKENTLSLNKVILRQKFQQLVKCHLNNRSRTIKQIVALRLYASNLKRRALRGLRRVSDAQILKQNRTRIEYNSKLSMQKSMEHVRKKSKLLETIERYNHSRISRVVR